MAGTGHFKNDATGFDESKILPAKVTGTFSIVPMLVDATEEEVPVLVCGGIADERTAKAAFALGAEGFASFGLGISMIHKVEPVVEIVDRLMDGIRDYM